MRVLGVTGGIGSGKSTVCALLAARGARIFYADDVAKRLQVSDPSIRSEIKKTFGEDAYLDDGSLNKPYLAGRIFSSSEDREAINRIVHPAVALAFRIERETAEREGVKLLVKEAALLLETDTRELDDILVVDSSQDERIRRVQARDGLSRDAVLDRMNMQWSAGEMKEKADLVLVNDGTLEELEDAVDMLYRELVKDEQGTP